jgi:uncharacterized membrane protein YedE/YeeE
VTFEASFPVRLQSIWVNAGVVAIDQNMREGVPEYDGLYPLASLAGGILIALAAAFLMALNGKVAGISGISAGLLSLEKPGPDTGWRIAFVAGLVAAPPLLSAAGLVIAPIIFVAPPSVMIAAGLLVGFRTVLGNGCTSGHGVCCIARLSPGSLVATAVFMVAGMATVYVIHHFLAGA